MDYFKELVPRVRINGIILFDSMLAKGRIAAGAGRSVVARHLNELAAADVRVEAMRLPIGDGMLTCQVKG